MGCGGLYLVVIVSGFVVIGCMYYVVITGDNMVILHEGINVLTFEKS